MRQLHLSIVGHMQPLAGEAIYLRHDHAFRFKVAVPDAARERTGTMGTAAIALDTLEVEVGVETGLCLWLAGYSPVTGWRQRAVTPPASEAGARPLRS